MLSDRTLPPPHFTGRVCDVSPNKSNAYDAEMDIPIKNGGNGVYISIGQSSVYPGSPHGPLVW